MNNNNITVESYPGFGEETESSLRSGESDLEWFANSLTQWMLDTSAKLRIRREIRTLVEAESCPESGPKSDSRSVLSGSKLS